MSVNQFNFLSCQDFLVKGFKVDFESGCANLCMVISPPAWLRGYGDVYVFFKQVMDFRIENVHEDRFLSTSISGFEVVNKEGLIFVSILANVGRQYEIICRDIEEVVKEKADKGGEGARPP